MDRYTLWLDYEATEGGYRPTATAWSETDAKVRVEEARSSRTFGERSTAKVLGLSRGKYRKLRAGLSVLDDKARGEFDAHARMFICDLPYADASDPVVTPPGDLSAMCRRLLAPHEGTILRSLAATKGLSLREVGQRMRLSHSALSRGLAGHRKISPDTFLLCVRVVPPLRVSANAHFAAVPYQHATLLDGVRLGGDLGDVDPTWKVLEPGESMKAGAFRLTRSKHDAIPWSRKDESYGAIFLVKCWRTDELVLRISTKPRWLQLPEVLIALTGTAFRLGYAQELISMTRTMARNLRIIRVDVAHDVALPFSLLFPVQNAEKQLWRRMDAFPRTVTSERTTSGSQQHAYRLLR